MIEFGFLMNFRDPLNLNLVASKIIPAMEESPYKHVFSTPTVIVFQHEAGYQIVFEPTRFKFTMLGNFEYNEIEDQIPSIIQAYSSVLGRADKQYFLVKYVTCSKNEGDTFSDSKKLMAQSTNDLFPDLMAAGIKLLFRSEYNSGALDEFKYEPLLSDNSKWYASGVFNCSISENSEVQDIIKNTYKVFCNRIELV